jgi:hypothetical protein
MSEMPIDSSFRIVGMMSSSGKTLVVASTHGNIVTSARVDDKPITLGLNAYIKP